MVALANQNNFFHKTINKDRVKSWEEQENYMVPVPVQKIGKS